MEAAGECSGNGGFGDDGGNGSDAGSHGFGHGDGGLVVVTMVTTRVVLVLAVVMLRNPLVPWGEGLSGSSSYPGSKLTPRW